MEFIDLKKQYQLYQKEIDKAIHQVLEHGKYIMGPEVQILENELARFVGVNHCITTSSGTDSLLIALMALGIGPGDEVITVPFTWISTAEVIALLGAKPVFVDIDLESYTIDIQKIEQAITSKTKAILPVSLFGQMPNYDAINQIGDQYGIAVIEDGAQSFGALQNGRKSCGATLIGTTSFFPAKPLGCYGDGGAIFTNDCALAESMQEIRNHGGKVRHHHVRIGINGRFDTLQAAILLEKFKHFPNELESREKVGHYYNELLKDVCEVPKTAPGNTHVYAQYTVRVTNREEIKINLGRNGIPCGIYYPICLHEQPAFSYLNYQKGSFPCSEQASREVLSLPMHPWLTQDEQNEVVEHFKQALLITA